MFKHILVPLDGSVLAECVFPHVSAMAQAAEARISLIHVLESSRAHAPAIDPLDWHMVKATAEAYLNETSVRLKTAGLQVESYLVEGQVTECIIKFAHQNDVDLIVLSSHGRSGLSDWNVSSVVQKIIPRIYISTFIVRAYQPIASTLTDLHYRRLLVPLDGSQRAECVIPALVLLARFHKSQLFLMHSVRKPEMLCRVPLVPEELELVERLTERNRTEATKYMEQICSQLPQDIDVHLLINDDGADSLHDLVEKEEIDLVILSAHGHSGRSRRPYGSVTLNFIAYGTTPLLIVQDISRDEAKKLRSAIVSPEYKGH
ncbi:MAG: universal stress protein [Anaerolineales bacterium]|nr:universal stress protein [Anaerolineales bacterium]